MLIINYLKGPKKGQRLLKKSVRLLLDGNNREYDRMERI